MKPPSETDPAVGHAAPSGSGGPPAGAVTLDQVARAAGVSPSTVSRILNGTAQVRADKREAVATRDWKRSQARLLATRG